MSQNSLTSLFSTGPKAPTRSVGNALSAFTKAASDLEAVQQQHTDYAQSCEERAAGLLTEANKSHAEVRKASRVLGKLKDLLGHEGE